MNYLFVMGASGSGKTTIAKKLQKIKPEKYKWLTQTTTRPARPNEKEGREYFFLTDEQYDLMEYEGQLVAKVKYEFPPARYGTPRKDLHISKTNIIVASIEGFLDAYNWISEGNQISVLFIKDVKPEVERDERNYSNEEKYNKIVLRTLSEGKQKFRLVEITHEDLKRIRNNKSLLLEYISERGL